MLPILLGLFAADLPVLTPEPADAHPGLKAADPLDDQHPLPRNPKRVADLTAERRAWFQAQLDADRIKFPAAAAHAADVRESTEAQVAILAQHYRTDVVASARRLAALTRLAAAGCELPDVVYSHRRYVRPDDVTADWIGEFAARFNRDGYSAFRRLHANWNATAYKHDKVHGKPGLASDDELQPFWAAVADHCRSTNRAASEEVVEIMRLALQSEFLGPDVNARYRRVDTGLKAAGASEWLRKTVDGINLIDWAWEARGTGLGNTVTDEGWQRFRERLEAAEDRFNTAFNLDSGRPEPSAGMITVCMGLSRDRDEMEKWFRRAVRADPVGWAAFSAKQEYLKPKWHGSEDELLAFARQCLRAATLDDLLRELVYLAYQEPVMGLTPFGVYSRPRVWADVRAAYEPYLAARPTDDGTRTRFFKLCVYCSQWPAADAHRQRLGDRWSRGEIKPDEWKAYNDLVDSMLKRKAPVGRTAP